jgi:uroporphyrinogen decarboxylase
VGPLIPHFLEAGFAALHPLEVKAGLDAAQLKAQYGGRLALFGNIDVRRLAAGPEAAAEEVRAKLAAAMPGGGYLFHSDHSVPSDVPLANYRAALAALDRCGRYD